MCDYLEFGFSANMYMLYLLSIFHFVGGKMLTRERAHFWLGGISRSISEGNLIDMEAQKSSKNCNITGMGMCNCFDVFIHYQQLLQVYLWKVLQKMKIIRKSLHYHRNIYTIIKKSKIVEAADYNKYYEEAKFIIKWVVYAVNI